MTLSVVMVTYNSLDVVEGALKSVVGLWDEVVVGDGGSTDGTVEIVKKYGGTIVLQKKGAAIGERKQELVERAKGEWILVLDADERLSHQLAQEIKYIMTHHKIKLEHENMMDPGVRRNDRAIVAYRIPYQNYVFGRPVYRGGEKYGKVRLFRRGFAWISPDPLHEEVIIKKGRVGELRGVIHHHSYRTPWQLLTKFTHYAWTASEMMVQKGDRVTIKKLFVYGPHMFWARYIEEKGYKDGWRGLVLAMAFGYMEGLTYWVQFARQLHKVVPCGTARNDLKKL